MKSIERTAEENSEDPFLIAMADQAKLVQASFENRQCSAEDAVEALLKEIENNEARKKEQAEKGFDGLTFFVYRTLLDANIDNPEEVTLKIKGAFIEYPNWKGSDRSLRELRNQVTFAICAATEDLDQVTELVDDLFQILEDPNRH
ncbi:MAG: hypothetical protein H6752_02105 [Candidatus Omnitrophica bacterium]|nr:hypothetical protein [Candidatus Omnitrophota bacterium]